MLSQKDESIMSIIENADNNIQKSVQRIFERNFFFNLKDDYTVSVNGPNATDDIPFCCWVFEPVDNITVHVVPRKHFFKVF